MTLLIELTEDYGDEYIPLAEALEEAVAIMNTRSRGGPIRTAMKGAAGFFKKHPGVTIAAATLALDSYSKYRANKRNTIKLFAKDAYEKKMMTDVVDALTQRGKYRVVKQKYADGGKFWVLKRK